MRNKLLYVVTVVSLLVDMVSKELVSRYLVLSERMEIIPEFFYFTYTKNTGVAFSFLEGRMSFIVIMTFVMLIGLGVYLVTRKLDGLEMVAYGLILGGAVGNLLNRMLNGYVVDFIDVHIFSYHYPIFNLADTFIVIGVIFIFFDMIRKERRK